MKPNVRVTHLVFGLLYLGIAAVWLLHARQVLTGDQLALSGPLVLIAAGVIGLGVSLASARRGERPARIGYDDPSAATTPFTSIENDQDRETHHD
jgi:hypothetical protein